MRFGVREICDVVLKAKTAMKVGSKVFYKNEPVCYFDSLKTSSLETQSNAVYAQGGRGNARLISWEGERTVTFTMEDALISPISFSILSGAGVIEATTDKPIYMHRTEQTNNVVLVPKAGSTTGEIAAVKITLQETPYVRGDIQMNSNSTGVEYGTAPSDAEDFIYVMVLDENGEVISEPFIAAEVASGTNVITIYADETTAAGKSNATGRQNNLELFKTHDVVLVDYYVEQTGKTKQINISPDTFGGNFYLEASTLFRTTQGVDVPAEFVIPNCKIQSNFTFTMAATGDPSTFTFTMDAFPDYTRWDRTKKVFAAIQFEDDLESLDNYRRLGTEHNNTAVATAYATQADAIENPKRTRI